MTTGRGERTVRVLLVTTGVVTATPALALLDPYALEWTYGVTNPDAMTLALLQHRGMLQFVLGAALVWAAWFRPARPAAALGAVATKTVFLALILPNAAIRGDLALFSVIFDLFCVVVLTAIAVRQLYPQFAARALPA
ncbi:hypothetical protein IU433_27785 [Nocardia puris]|uniref:DoxX-like protein n=1 Tax=Nocardia puris TaxID=208602 RepID=A0A366E3C4_9NOCA|nr:hypothetical protein [Nocardia puris]MBF6369038.1 hypothetical protein [Nocardia puris]MBF6462814.1 hypothetical protein [Nocardia puris]RBO96807.1 hypothetical protein DFR74_101824 [Nocardia puris]